MTIQLLSTLFKLYREKSLFGRYIMYEHVHPIFSSYQSIKFETLGYSVKGNPIDCLSCGNGPIKVLMWSQMHGNESTTTKAIVDIFNTLVAESLKCKHILEKLTIICVPILNPDGAANYTRNNANDIDLNRDAINLSQPESVILRQLFDKVQPNWCFNLHGQRTIFSAGETSKSATLSFLAPAQDETKTITVNRKKAMALIALINQSLQSIIPNQIGIYDDTFNANCVGDAFQKEGVPTVLVEAGHYKRDYNREDVRRLVYIALMKALTLISDQAIDANDYKNYTLIPPNKKLFYDIIIRNAFLNKESKMACDICIQYNERLVDNNIDFVPTIEKFTDLAKSYGHFEIDAHNTLVMDNDGNQLEVSNEIDFVLVNSEEISLKP